MYNSDYSPADAARDAEQDLRDEILQDARAAERRVQREHDERYGSPSDAFANHERIDRRR